MYYLCKVNCLAQRNLDMAMRGQKKMWPKERHLLFVNTVLVGIESIRVCLTCLRVCPDDALGAPQVDVDGAVAVGATVRGANHQVLDSTAGTINQTRFSF